MGRVRRHSGRNELPDHQRRPGWKFDESSLKIGSFNAAKDDLLFENGAFVKPKVPLN